MKSLVAVALCLLMLGSAVVPPGSGNEPGAREGPGPLAPGPVASFTNASAEVGLAGVGGNFFAWGDYDRDGHEDLLVDGQRLFRNSGPPGCTFTEVTAQAGIGGSGVNTGNWADYDNDGYLDLYCPSGGWSTDYDPRWDILWHNNGDGTFTNVTEAAGHVTDTFPSVAAGWGDYDRDGFVDLYVANYENASMSAYYPDVLWHNDGDGTFTNVTKTAGVDESADPKPGRGVSWCDYNNDGWPDIYVSNYRLTDNYLWQNDQDGTFTNVGFIKNVAGEANWRLGYSYFGHSVGSAWSDIDNDGDFDLWVTNLAHKDLYRGPICDDSELYRSNGSAGNYTFTNIRDGSGIPTKRIMGGEDELFVGCAWGDFNNDGYEDLFIPQIYNDVSYAYSCLYRNNGNNTFTDVSNESGVRVWDTYGGAWCDYDEDGDLDLITGGKGTADINDTHEVHLYKNLLNEQTGSTWIGLGLAGTKSNTAAIGARVYAYENPQYVQMREVQGGMGPHSMQNSMTVHFGYAGYTRYINIRIEWPSGTVQKLLFHEDEPVDHLNQTVIVTEPNDQPDLTPVQLVLSPASPVDGDLLHICATIRNAATVASSEYTVRISVDGKSVRDYDLKETLPAGATRTVDCPYDTTGRAGSHNVTVIASSTVPPDSDPGNDLKSWPFTVKPPGSGRPPVASLAASPSSVQVGQIVNFDAGGSFDPDGTVQAFEFTFGDGQSSGWVAGSVLQHSYGSAGTFTASLRVRDNASLVSDNTARATIQVSLPTNKLPNARIATILPNPASRGETVTFTGDAWDDDGTIADNLWSSSIDGELSRGQSFQSAGLSLGTHTISYSVRDDRGDWSPAVTRNLEVRPPPANQLPKAVIISISPSPATSGEAVKFTGTGEDSDGKVVDCRWSSSVQGFLGYGTPLTVANLTAGVHTIAFAVKDDKGAWSPDATARLDVREPPATEQPNKVPKASLSVSSVLIKTNEVVRLDASMSSDPDGRVMQYRFDFGDGTDTCWTLSATVDHSYPSAGQYVVRVKVRDDQGAQSPWSRDILVEVKAPKAPAPSKGFIPGMEAALTVPALLGALAAIGRRIKWSG